MTLETLVGVVGIGVFAIVAVAGMMLFRAWYRSDASVTPAIGSVPRGANPEAPSTD